VTEEIEKGFLRILREDAVDKVATFVQGLDAEVKTFLMVLAGLLEHKDVVTELIKAGAWLDGFVQWPQPSLIPLFYAVKAKNYWFTKVLLDAGVDPNVGILVKKEAGKMGIFPLLAVAMDEKIYEFLTFQALLKAKNLDVDKTFDNQITALMVAVAKGDYCMVHSLLDLGADPEKTGVFFTKSTRGESVKCSMKAIDFAKKYGHSSVVFLLESVASKRVGAKGAAGKFLN
jgi:hypothetical protein